MEMLHATCTCPAVYCGSLGNIFAFPNAISFKSGCTGKYAEPQGHRNRIWEQVRKGKADVRLVSATQGCTKGFHSKEKPPEPSQEETSDKPKAKPMAEIIVQGPKSAEEMQRERPR